MSSTVTLLHRYIVNLIASIPSFADSFAEHGGFDEKLVDRVMNTFSVVETAHLQNASVGNTITSTSKATKFIMDLADNNRGGDLIDLWKEVCNGRAEKSQMSVGLMIYRVLREVKNPPAEALGYLSIPTAEQRYTGYLSVDNVWIAMNRIYQEVICSTKVAWVQENLNRLMEMLESYPYLQKKFVEDNFNMTLQSRLAVCDDPVKRGATLFEFLNAEFKNTSNVPLYGASENHSKQHEVPAAKPEPTPSQEKETVTVTGDPTSALAQQIAELFHVPLTAVRRHMDRLNEEPSPPRVTSLAAMGIHNFYKSCQGEGYLPPQGVSEISETKIYTFTRTGPYPHSAPVVYRLTYSDGVGQFEFARILPNGENYFRPLMQSISGSLTTMLEVFKMIRLSITNG